MSNMSELDIKVHNETRALRKKFRAHKMFNEAMADIRVGQVCCTCRKRLPRGMFSASIVRGRSYLHKRCIQCRATVYLRSKTCKEKRALIDKLRDVPCADCHQKFDTNVMVFSHVRGSHKFNVSMAWTGRRREAILEEAKKCDVICSNCMTKRKKARRQPAWSRRSKLAELPPDLATQVDLTARLEQLHGPQSLAG